MSSQDTGDFATSASGSLLSHGGSLHLPSFLSPEDRKALEKHLETTGRMTAAYSSLPPTLVRSIYYSIAQVQLLLERRSKSQVEDSKAGCLNLGGQEEILNNKQTLSL